VLVKIIRSYIREFEFEQNATSVADAEKRLEKLAEAATAFWQALDCPPEGLGREADAHVEGLLNDYFEGHGRSENPIRVTHLSHIMLTFVEGCDWAKRRLEISKGQQGNFKPNTAWKSALIGPLAEFWEDTLKRGRVKIRKDTDKMRCGWTDAPFVTFVKEIERALPERFRQVHSDPSAYQEAYQAAVSRAVSDWRKSGAKLVKSS
jgi:hypothetical protein